MNIIKFILAAIGLIFVGMLLLWVLGFLSSIIYYVFWIGLFGLIAYGGYRLFRRAESRLLGDDVHAGLKSGADIPMTWDEYDKKYLHK